MSLAESLFIQGENPIILDEGSKQVHNLQFYHPQNSEVWVKAVSSIRLFNDLQNSSFLAFKIGITQCRIGEIYLNNSFT